MKRIEGKILFEEKEARKKLLEGAESAYKTVAVSYGPKGRNALLEKTFGRPLLTRDGVTIAKDVFFSDRPTNLGAKLLIEASEATNRIAGDGTTATTVLSYFLFKESAEAISKGTHPMAIKDSLSEDKIVLLEELEKLAIKVKDSQLKDVATVSVGDPLLGQLIAEAVLYVGKDGGILTEKALLSEIEREYIDGLYLESGFTALQAGKKELIDPFTVVSSKKITSAADAIQMLESIMRVGRLKPGEIPRVLFVGNFEEAAYATIVNSINQGTLDAVVIKTPPSYGEAGKHLLEDIAIYAGCRPFTDGDSIRQFAIERNNQYLSPFIGKVDKVVASKSESTIFADNETEAVLSRIAEIKEQAENEPVDAFAEKLRNRLAKLEGKIAIFKIGGATETEKEELEFRIEDAINSTRNAYTDGIVAGGGVTLLELSKLDISDIYRNALRSTFKQLLINAGLDEEAKLKEALKADKGLGFNLRAGGELVDVVKEGIIDPVTVPREVITNATSVIGGAVTVGVMLVHEDTEE